MIALSPLFVALAVSGAAGSDRSPEPAGSAKLAPDVKASVDRMQAFYEKTSDFEAHFKQVYSYKSSGRTQTSTGKITFLRPGMMRWDYERPTQKTFLLSGNQVRVYDAEAMTLTIASVASDQLSSSVTFLWGRGRLETEFQITKAPCASCRGALLELKPISPDARYQKILLEVDPKSAQVLKSTVIDPDGSENAIEFTDLKRNVGVSKERFTLKIPEGTQTIDLTKP